MISKPSHRASLCLLVGLACSDVSAAGFTYSFTNSQPIRVNDTTNQLTKGVPYQASCPVAGLDGLVISKVTLTLNGLTHAFPSDIGVMLVGPQGQSAVAMAETGGQNRYSVTNLVLVLDDDAHDSLPVFTSLYSGTFKPTDGYIGLGYPNLPYDFPAPAPAGNSNSPATFSIFKHTNPNGAWNLYSIADAAGADFGLISNGWILNLSVQVPLQITLSQTNVIVSWPASATNGILQASSDIANVSGWSNVLVSPAVVSGKLTVTNPASSGRMFYRLVN